MESHLNYSGAWPDTKRTLSDNRDVHQGKAMVKNDISNWDRLASDIESAVNESWQMFKSLPNETVLARPEPGEWSVKEIIGHLVDSAANNHQRFVRLQVANGLVFPDYSQDNDSWVSIQRYQVAHWDDLLTLLRHFNLHLARVIRTVDVECIDHIWVIDEGTTITLGELMIDYLRHLKDHLQHIKKRIGNIP